jgi:protein ImuB
VIVALSIEAAAFGIRAGMTLTQARALCAHVGHAEREPRRDDRALEALARWLMRFSPVVALAGQTMSDVARAARPCLSAKEKNTGGPPVPQGIFLDITGCGRLFGGIDTLARQVSQALSRLRISVRLAVAPTPGAAWALAEAGKNGSIVSEEELAAALSPLPPAALRLSEGLVAALHHLGLATIGQVANLPRDVLPARFGSELLLRLDQAFGRIAEPLVPLEHHAPVEAKMEFDGPVSSLEAIHAVTRHLLEEVIAQLTRRGCGARRLDLELSRAYAPPVKKSILLSHPSREGRSLFNLVQCALEDANSNGKKFSPRRHGDTEALSTPRAALQLIKKNRLLLARKPQAVNGASVSPCLRGESPDCFPSSTLHDDGYTALHLRVPLLQRVSDEQIFLLDQERHAGRLEVDHLVDRLRLRLGEEGVARVKLVESHLPEKAWERVQSAKCKVQNEKRETPSSFFTFHFSLFTSLPRPLHLLPTPAELRVMVTPSHAAEGRPAAFVHEHRVHQVTNWSGPERIAGCWWDGHNKTRDYFEVEDPTGRRFWIFRVSQTRKWYLHGEW